MLQFKNSALAVLCLTSASVWAGTMGPVCEPGTVSLPCTATTWGIGADFLYLKPSSSGHNYIGSVTNSNSVQTEEYFINEKIGYGPGFKIEGFYNFRTGNDINLNWYHFNMSNQQALPNGISVFDSVFGGNVVATYTERWDAVNLELGQLVNAGAWGKFRLHGGATYANVVKNARETGTNTLPTYSQYRNNQSSFNGWGGRVGGDLSYLVGYNTSVYANAAAAVIFGTNHFNRQWAYYTTYPSTFTSGNYGSAQSIIPELDTKLGAKYDYQLSNSTLTLDIGWMWTCYVNAIQIADSGHNGRTKEGNFAIQGLFVGGKWSGNLI